MEMALYIISAIIFFILFYFSQGSKLVSGKILTVVSLICAIVSCIAIVVHIVLV